MIKWWAVTQQGNTIKSVPFFADKAEMQKNNSYCFIADGRVVNFDIKIIELTQNNARAELLQRTQHNT